MIKSDEQFFLALEKRPLAELSTTEKQELNLLLESELLQKAVKHCLESTTAAAQKFLNFDLSTEKGRMDATRLQGTTRGQMLFLGQLVDLSLPKDEAPQPQPEKTS
jgi:hypothetical protein